MHKNLSTFQIYLSAFLAIIMFLQSYNWWTEEKLVLAIFFLSLGIINIVIISIWLFGRNRSYKKS
ncbi:hypothetical protein SM124_06430 [Bacillus sp. 31A1R]|uniref:Uncharacterized protein n=1 Tax=Robertmurraya mangrovi TaxID=3098077 RepID=A0ABU5IW54_9BACI|nr:hypothetical protein [Bacillus sp. 31A1R]MDZ5471380.1 hypothetical protein [Bacillus sp. 31A1R]